MLWVGNLVSLRHIPEGGELQMHNTSYVIYILYSVHYNSIIATQNKKCIQFY